MLPHLRLLQLLSPVLPVGAYSYSQGLEWAVEHGWVTNRDEFEHWLDELIDGPLTQQDLPLLRQLYHCCSNAEIDGFNYWSSAGVAFRDTAELRAEERARAQAYLRVLQALPENIEAQYLDGIQRTPFAALAWAAVRWDIEEQSLLNAYAYNWLDAHIVNGVKIIPLGQSDGQALLHARLPALSRASESSVAIAAGSIGFSVPSVAMASCSHEFQYSRLYRS